MAVWYLRDNSTVNSGNPASLTVGSVGWSNITAWSAGASIAPGTIRRQSAANAVFTATQSTTVITVSAVTSGTIYVGMTLKLPNATTETISSLGTGTGGTGTYNTATSQSVSSGTWNGGMPFTNARCFVATQSGTGTTGSTEPNWTITKGGSTTDNTVTWIECTGQPAVNGDMTNTPASSTVRSSSPGRGKIIKDNAGTHIFIQTSAAGTTGSGEPTYVTTSVGSTTTDGTVTWTYIGPSFSNWASPFAYLIDVFGSSWAAAGDTVYAGDDHSEIVGTGNNYTITPTGTVASPNFLYSIDHTLSLPVSSGGLKAGATIATQTTVFLESQTVSGSAYYYGFTFAAGTGNNASALEFGNAASWMKLDNCTLKLSNTSNSVTSKILFLGLTEMVNGTSLVFGNAANTIDSASSSEVIWRNGSIGGATFPTTLFAATGSGICTLEGVDLSAIGSATIQPAGTAGQNSLYLNLIDCKLGSGATIGATPNSSVGPFTDAVRCSSTSSTYIQRRYWYEGTLQEEATIIRTGGASDGTTGISWNITTTANSKWVDPFESFPVAIWNGVTATNRTITLHGIWNSASLPNNDDVWVDVEYLGDSGSPLASFGTATKSNNLASGSALTADSSSAWDSQASARQNTHAYSLGNVIATSSNAGRIFFCTTAGTSNGSEPVGYAGAADGGSVTDGTAVFRAGTRFLLTVTLSTPQPQLVGYLRAYVKAAKASSTFYVDPLIVLS